jgi:alkyl hydroperoxide reductase subunit F
MLDTNLKTQLEGYLKNIVHPVELVASLGAGPKSQELKALLEDIVSVSHGKVEMGRDFDDVRQPSFLIRRKGTDIGVRFAGIPLGHEFTSLVLALLHVGGHPSKAAQEVIQQVKDLDGDYLFETYFSLSCQNCPDVVQALNLMSVINPRIKHVAIEGGLFKDEVEARKVMAVPTVFLNG